MGAENERQGKTEGDKRRQMVSERYNKNHTGIYDQVYEMLKIQTRSEFLLDFYLNEFIPS
jgi:Fic family protein